MRKEIMQEMQYLQHTTIRTAQNQHKEIDIALADVTLPWITLDEFW